MGPLEEAIGQFTQKRLAVYRADSQQIVRDTRAAERATGDHTGRWLFELLQNSDDAGASKVLVLVEEETVYVADNGLGLKPKAVSAICGTDFSDKTGGTIGRKGIGFKSVYEVSRNPQVLTVDGEGIEFNLERAKAWLQHNSLDDSHVPYQWIPFPIAWDRVQGEDPQLGSLTTFKTVVRLRGVPQDKKQKAEQLLTGWPPHALLAFRHLRRITAPGLEVVLSPGDGVWSLRDNRGQTPEQWRVIRLPEHPPAELLETLGADERRAISTDGVSFLIAAPLENGCVVPTTEYLPVHVFYPTEQKGPVRLLLHAEFLVKSDRTALLPVDGNPFNDWVAKRLAYHVCEFVNDAYRPEAPSSHAALLVPFDDRASHPVADSLWQRIAATAQADLRFADIEARQRLTVGEASLISVSVRADLARTLLKATSVRGRLLDSAFDDDKEARKALRALCCNEIHDQDLMTAIAENADSCATNAQWVWTCWEWLAAWIAKEPYGEEHMKRIERVRALPLVPVGRSLMKASDLAGRIMTWKPDASVGNLPDWLPLTFVEDWFRDRIHTETQESSVRRLCDELGITEPGADVIQRAVGRAIEEYWKDPRGDPERFLRFILDQDWHETSIASPPLRRCPMPLSQPAPGQAWSEAKTAYFGREWGNDLLADLYAGIEAVDWAARDDSRDNETNLHRVLEWLGVTTSPRISVECQQMHVWQLPGDCGRWKQYLESARDYCGRHVERIASVSRMDHLELDSLDARLGSLIIRLVARDWEAYYHTRAEVAAEGSLSRERYYRSWQVKAKWWWEVCERLPVPRRDCCAEHVALTSLWLPDRRTERTIGDLLPAIDLDAFGDDKGVVGDWLVSAVGLRTRIEQLTVGEWKTLLSAYTPDSAPIERLVSDERLRDRVMGWYAACLETVAEQENFPQKAFAPCPLLCRKAGSWAYVAKEPRYLDDDNELATAFAEDVWLFHVPARLAADAVKYLDVMPLSGSIRVDVTPGEPKSTLADALATRFNDSLPYVWAWRSSQRKQDAERLAARLKGMKVYVVPALEANLSLNGVHHKVERRWYVSEDTIFLHKDHADDAELAEALAKAVDARSEADFYENLLRCNDPHQRKEKLLSKGIADAEVERCLREYSRRPAEEQQEEGQREPAKNEREGTPAQTSSADIGQRLQREHSTTEQHGETPETSSGPLSAEKQPLRLKNASTADFVLGSPPEVEAGTSGGGGGGGGMGQEACLLTNTEKIELEKAGRGIAARRLKEIGFIVEDMPFDNKGFDLRARRSNEELRVEVKAHVGRATVVDVTHPQYKEYLGQQGYCWELWNVEHLAESDTNQVVLTRYDRIPDDALDVRTFRVDLKRCQTPSDP
jgi:hypothetical protein